MNPRLALYLSGAAFHTRTISRKGKRTAVFDRTRRIKVAARAMRKAGLRDYQISTALGCRRAALEKVLAFDWRF